MFLTNSKLKSEDLGVDFVLPLSQEEEEEQQEQPLTQIFLKETY